VLRIINSSTIHAGKVHTGTTTSRKLGQHFIPNSKFYVVRKILGHRPQSLQVHSFSGNHTQHRN